MDLERLALALRDGPAFAAKRDIAPVLRSLALGEFDPVAGRAIAIGDDCAAIPDGDGTLLLAIEGFLGSLVEAMPWFAGWCGIMVNLSDIAAMGGRPVAVVDALWAPDHAHREPILRGLADASRAYGVPVVGGHTGAGAAANLAVAVLGRAQRLLTSFDARPGDLLVAAIDLRGAWHEPYPFWDAASRGAPPERLRADLDILPRLAEAGLCRAAKDISNAGLAGTALMLAECSGIGITLDLGRIPRPPGAGIERWLGAFPSYGFLLAVTPDHAPAVLQAFASRDIAAAVIGTCEAGSRLDLLHDGVRATCWDHAEHRLLGCAPP